MAPRNPHLPIEIQDLILDTLLVLDKRSPRTLSVLCQRSRQRLYRSAFADVRLDPSSAITFSRLLDSSFSSLVILPSIQRIHFHTKPQHPWTYITLTSARPVLAGFRHHARMGLHGSSTQHKGNPELDFAGLSLPTFPSVHNLKLQRVAFNTSTEFGHFFSLFPSLKQVEFNDVLCGWDEEGSTTLPPGEFKLALIVHDEIKCGVTITWTLTESILSIEPKDLHCLGRLLQADTHILIQKISPALRELDVDLQLYRSHGLPLEGIVNALDLSDAPHLRYLRIGSSTQVLSCLFWLPKVLYGLSAAKHPSLKVLAIRFASSRQFHLDRPFLRCFTRRICKRQYSAVREIHFIACHDTPFDKGVEHNIKQSIQTELIQYHEQGRVWVMFHER